MGKKLSFEDSIERLKEIVDTLSSGTISLEDSLKLFEEGSAISAACYETLRDAEQKITDISGKIGEKKGEEGNS